MYQTMYTETTLLSMIEEFVQKKVLSLQIYQKNFEDSIDKRNRLIEKRAICIESQQLIQRQLGQQMSQYLTWISGTIDSSDELRFKRTIFRVSKSNCYCDVKQINNISQSYRLVNSKSKEPIKRSVFILLFMANEGGFMQGKLRKVCDSFSAYIADLPQNIGNTKQLIQGIEKEILDANSYVNL